MQISQTASFVMSIAIMVFALWSIKLKHYKVYSGVMWFLFGLVGFLFYVDVLIFDYIHFMNGNELSATRTLVQYTLVAAWLLFWSLKNIHHRKY